MSTCNCKHGSSGTSAICVECDIPQLARNNFFTGKLLVERDFTDEQHYFMGKDRRHNQRLHGWGAVCGLKVSPHPNPACADQYVLIDPGTAIDCCGREILVRHQECFDFKSAYLSHWQAQHGPDTKPGDTPVDLQICISYRECAAEEVPALFDDCGSTSSKPNRILESYGFDVLVKKPGEGPTGGVDVEWLSTLNFANPVRAVRHESSKRIYILTSTATTTVLYALDSTNESIVIPPQTFASSAGLDVAVSPGGDFVYVVTQPNAASAKPKLLVLKSADLSQANSIDIGTATDATVRIAVIPAPDGRVISYGKTAGVLVWPSSLSSGSPAPTSVAITNPIDLAVSPNAQFAYVLSSGSNNVSAIALTDPALAVETFPVGAAPSAIAAAATTAGDRLAVLDPSGTPTLFFVGLPSGPTAPASLGSAKGFANPPIGVKFSPGGRWAFVLEQDASQKVFLQTVDEHAAEFNTGNILSAAEPIGAGAASAFITDDGKLLYVPYAGTATTPGAIAVLSITAGNCADLLSHAIEPCPDCDEGNCIILATIKGYIYGSPVTAAQIDNLTDRHILASTSLLTDIVRCLLDQGGGEGKTGPQGPPGAPGQNGQGGAAGLPGGPGPAGPGIDLVTVKEVPCDQPATAVLTGQSPSRTLELTLPTCCGKDLTGIADVSWKENGATVKMTSLVEPGLSVAFTGTVNATDLHIQDIALLVPIPNKALTIWEEVQLKIVPGNFATLGKTSSPFSSAAGMVNGFRMMISSDAVAMLREFKVQSARVVIKGDFIRDANKRALDGDHLPPWLPQKPTGDGIEGGTFESWMTIKIE